MNNPFNYIDLWDILILVFGMALKMFYSLNTKVKGMKEENFDVKKYFDAKHIIRWTGHIVASFSFILFAPQFILDYGSKLIPGFSGQWYGLASFCVGFFGYDLLKIIEKIGVKIGIDPTKKK